jgi:polyhydroxyalkanoate synthesis regulator phasin
MSEEKTLTEQLKKALTTGVGLALKTWDEVEARAKEVIQKAKLSEKDAESLLNGLRNNFERTQKSFEDRAGRLMKDMLKRANVPTRDEVSALRREIQRLKKELKEAKVPKTAKPKAPKPRTKTAGAAGKAKARTKAKATPKPKPAS